MLFRSPVRRSLADIAEDGEPREQTIDLVFVYSGTQAQRCAEVIRRKSRLQASAVVQLGPRYMLAEDGDWIEWTSARHFGGETRLFEVQGIALDNKGNIRLALQQTAESVFAWNPAAVTATFLGFPGTTGADGIDYIVGDPRVTPLEHAAWYSEQIAQMPVCYQPNDRQRALPPPPSRADAGLPDDAFVMAGFNQPYKISAEVFDVWCVLLDALPQAVLWLLEWNEQSRQNIEREAAARHLPLIDYHAALAGVPSEGISDDNVHPSVFVEGGDTRAAVFTPAGLRYGYNVRNLTLLLGAQDANWFCFGCRASKTAGAAIRLEEVPLREVLQRTPVWPKPPAPWVSAAPRCIANWACASRRLPINPEARVGRAPLETASSRLATGIQRASTREDGAMAAQAPSPTAAAHGCGAKPTQRPPAGSASVISSRASRRATASQNIATANARSSGAAIATAPSTSSPAWAAAIESPCVGWNTWC